jgi:pimeloyl-ACP methyl ester carboxylesterase
VPLPDGRIVLVPDQGEMFVRDSGGRGTPLLLLHGWAVASDLNWAPVYGSLAHAGFRVLATDHRGHGRGLRPDAPFRLRDCADDAAALLRTLDTGPAIVVGYSMGGPIAQLMARDHPDVVRALVVCATAAAWDDPGMKVVWRTMGVTRLYLTLFPRQAWRWGLRASGMRDSQATSWTAAELSRGAGRDIAEAGRELGRYDGRDWLPSLRGLTSASVVTTRDRAVPPRKQRELARLLGAPVFEAPVDHLGVSLAAARFGPALLAALGDVARRLDGQPAAGADAADSAAGASAGR